MLHSASILANEFIYDGNLCSVNNSIRQVRLLDVHEADGWEHVLKSNPDPGYTDVIPVAYDHGILGLRLESETPQDDPEEEEATSAAAVKQEPMRPETKRWNID